MKTYYRFHGQFVTDKFIDVIANDYDEALRIADEHMHAAVNELLTTDRGLDFYAPDIHVQNTEDGEQPSTEFSIETVADWAFTSEDYPDDPT